MAPPTGVDRRDGAVTAAGAAGSGSVVPMSPGEASGIAIGRRAGAPPTAGAPGEGVRGTTIVAPHGDADRRGWDARPDDSRGYRRPTDRPPTGRGGYRPGGGGHGGFRGQDRYDRPRPPLEGRPGPPPRDDRGRPDRPPSARPYAGPPRDRPYAGPPRDRPYAGPPRDRPYAGPPGIADPPRDRPDPVRSDPVLARRTGERSLLVAGPTPRVAGPARRRHRKGAHSPRTRS